MPGEIPFGAGNNAGDVHSGGHLPHRNHSAFGIVAGHADEIFGLGVWQRAKQNSIHKAEHGSVAANSESEGKNGYDGKTGSLPERAKAITQVLYELLQPEPPPGFADVFLNDGGIAKRSGGGVARLLEGQAGV